METVTIASILTSVGSVVTSAIGWCSSYLTAITDSPVLTLFCIALPLVGLGIGILSRLIGSRF